MPFVAPSAARMPPLDFLLADQIEPPKRIARHLGVSLQRWRASGNAPRAAYLALWFESRWGMAALHTQAFNEAQHARARVASLERQCERLRRVIHAYESAETQPASNAPAFTAI
ncbi:hypothetical protein [Variovorax sp. dw_954]|uniref:hypothetical protein n=1 Tax=Variovorax sp. dw_954 TaxID=2720078 RepID=UPI001BD6B5C9|nr:hypothetical protein [Variovorax sp. dw_954]